MHCFLQPLYKCTTMMTLKKSKQMAKIRQYINDALNSFFLKARAGADSENFRKKCVSFEL